MYRISEYVYIETIDAVKGTEILWRYAIFTNKKKILV